MSNILETPSGMNAIDLLETVRTETRAVEGHTDPKAIDDVIDELQDWAKGLTIHFHNKARVERLANGVFAAMVADRQHIGSFYDRLAKESIKLAEALIKELDENYG